MGEKKKHKHKKKHSRSRSKSKERFEPDQNQYHEKNISSTVPTTSYVSSGGGGGGDELSLSVDATNKIRAQLGLAPLKVDHGSSQDAGAEEKESLKDDIHVPAINMRNERQSEEMRAKLALIREKRKINQKLGKVKRLAEDSDEEDTLTWVKRSRKMQEEKTKAEARAQTLAEMDAEFGVDFLVQEEFQAKQKRYTSKSLKGLKVAHDESSFKEGQTVILTLQDEDILENTGDAEVLMNLNLRDDEIVVQNAERKKRVKDYNPFDDDDFDGEINMEQKGILEKYDEVIDGEKKYEFMLGNYGRYDAEFEKSIKKYKSDVQNSAETLYIRPPTIANEYYTPDEMENFKSVKKKIRKIRKKEKPLKADQLAPVEETNVRHHGSRRHHWDGDEEGPEASDEVIQIDAPKSDIPGLDLVEVPKLDLDESALDDEIGPIEDLTGVTIDDDGAAQLQVMINKSRRVKRAKQVKPENIISDHVEEANNKKEDIEDFLNPKLNTNITLNQTSEFCRSLGEITTYAQAGNRLTEEEDELKELKEELETEQERMAAEQDGASGAWQSVEIIDIPADITEEEYLAIDEEPTIDGGLGGALKLAMRKGFIEKEEIKALKICKQKADLEAKSYSIEDKKYEDLDEKYRKRANRYDGGGGSSFSELDRYAPNFKLEYVDEGGRALNEKEAFRQLSHRFHGKGSGKKKIEKRAAKVDQQNLLDNASSTDTPLGTVELLRQKQVSEQTPYLVLSGTNKVLTGGNLAKT